MILVTVGTDHHPFDRLIRAVDGIKASGGLHDEEVLVQSGSARFRPAHCRFREWMGFDELMGQIENARMVITHGGPGSIMPVLHRGKVPVVLAREKRYGEVVDDHQARFATRLRDEGLILFAEDESRLMEMVLGYDRLVREMISGDASGEHRVRLERFVDNLEKLCLSLFSNR